MRLGERDNGLLALWAAECVLPCFEEKYPQDDRPRRLSRHARRCRGPHLSDAEDAVQETWLRWSGVDHSAVVDPRAFLVRVTTRLAIDRLRRAEQHREHKTPYLCGICNPVQRSATLDGTLVAGAGRPSVSARINLLQPYCNRADTHQYVTDNTKP